MIPLRFIFKQQSVLNAHFPFFYYNQEGAGFFSRSENLLKIEGGLVDIFTKFSFVAIEVCKQRLTPAHFVRTVLLSEEYAPDTALEAGFFDCTLPTHEEVMEKALATAISYSKLDLDAHYRTKLRTRKHLIKALKKANRFDKLDIVRQGVRRMFKK